MKGITQTNQHQTNDVVNVQNSTTQKINKTALFFFTCSLVVAAATITTAILYQGTARFWIVGTGGGLTIVFVILGFKSNKKNIESNLDNHYRTTIVNGLVLTTEPLSIDADLNSSLSTSSDINKDLEMGYMAFVDTHGTAPFENGQILVASKEFQDAFVKYITQELHITEFLNSKYCGNFLLKFNLIQIVNKDFAKILPKIKELSISTKEPSVINHGWQVWLKLRVNGLFQDRHLK